MALVRGCAVAVAARLLYCGEGSFRRALLSSVDWRRGGGSGGSGGSVATGHQRMAIASSSSRP
eukprot:COSAG01_NODE_3193_length_6435_cov_5.956597_6_plen_63_part_00